MWARCKPRWLVLSDYSCGGRKFSLFFWRLLYLHFWISFDGGNGDPSRFLQSSGKHCCTNDVFYRSDCHLDSMACILWTNRVWSVPSARRWRQLNYCPWYSHIQLQLHYNGKHFIQTGKRQRLIQGQQLIWPLLFIMIRYLLGWIASSQMWTFTRYYGSPSSSLPFSIYFWVSGSDDVVLSFSSVIFS